MQNSFHNIGIMAHVDADKREDIPNNVFSGARYSDSGIVASGDIAAICGLPFAKTGACSG